LIKCDNKNFGMKGMNDKCLEMSLYVIVM